MDHTLAQTSHSPASPHLNMIAEELYLQIQTLDKSIAQIHGKISNGTIKFPQYEPGWIAIFVNPSNLIYPSLAWRSTINLIYFDRQPSYLYCLIWLSMVCCSTHIFLHTHKKPSWYRSFLFLLTVVLDVVVQAFDASSFDEFRSWMIWGKVLWLFPFLANTVLFGGVFVSCILAFWKGKSFDEPWEGTQLTEVEEILVKVIEKWVWRFMVLTVVCLPIGFWLVVAGCLLKMGFLIRDLNNAYKRTRNREAERKRNSQQEEKDHDQHEKTHDLMNVVKE